MSWPEWIKIPPDWFDEEGYLKANPGVASSPFFKSRPFEHFISSGYPQGFTWDGDPRKITVKPPVVPPVGGGSLKIGETYRVRVDGFRGKEDYTEPIPEKNNPEFGRHNVKRAYKSGKSYWYTSRRHGKGYVDILVDWSVLGEGKYRVETPVRMTRNRAKYEAEYEVWDASGQIDTVHRFAQYSEESKWITVEFDLSVMKEGMWLRMADNKGSSSVCFGEVKLTRLS